MSGVKRIYVEKKPPYAVKARELKEDIEGYLGISNIEHVRVLIRYDVEGLSEATFDRACGYVFSEPPVDTLYKDDISLSPSEHMFSVEFLPGQYDQRADSAAQCVRFLDEDSDPIIKTAVTYISRARRGNLLTNKNAVRLGGVFVLRSLVRSRLAKSSRS